MDKELSNIGNIELKRGRPKKELTQDKIERLKSENAYLKLLIERYLKKEK